MKGTKEFQEVMDQFEKVAKDLIYGHKIERAKREDNPSRKEFYWDGYVNDMFLAFLAGYQYHKAIANLDA